ncbi:hypothetical protein BDQ17DRAFT_1351446 [Cyathus striatus]|nr:hypothetical protein BDQ17DRAFT_1351446 [Cyathus striatus]
MIMQSFIPAAVNRNTGPAAVQPVLGITQLPSNDDRVRMEVYRLLDKASYNLTCSRSASAFKNAVQPTARFRLALEVLLPVLDSPRSAELAQRILVSYILYSLYEPHPITMNPFKSLLYNTFVTERKKAEVASKEGRASPSEQIVWVLWKILKGDGSDIGLFTPGTLARGTIPPELRTSDLVLDEEAYSSNSVDRYEPVDNSTPSTGSSVSSDTSDSYSSSYAEAIQKNVEPVEVNEQLLQAMKLLLQARERVLRLSEQRMLLKNASEDNNHLHRFLDVLPFLPPCLPTFDLIGRMLGDATLINIPASWSLHSRCIEWIERADREQMENGYSDDRVPKAIQEWGIFVRFFTSLIKRGIVDPTSDADVTEVMHFSVRFSRYEDANALYRFIINGH